MPLTVRNVLELEAFRGCRPLTGEGGLDNPVHCLNFLEILDELGHLEEGELLITTGFDLHHQDEAYYRNLLHKLNAKKIAALAIQTGYYLPEVPAALISLAASLGLPVLQIPPQASFKDLNRAVTGALMERETLRNTYREKINRTLMEAFFNGGLPALIRTLEKEIKHPVRLYSAFLEPLDGDPSDLDRELMNIFLPLAGRAVDEKEWLETAPGEGVPGCIFWSIRLNEETHGYLCVQRGEQPLGEKEWIALRQAASICLLELVKLNSLLETKTEQVRKLLGRLLEGEKPEKLREQLKALKLDPAEKTLVLLLEAVHKESPVADQDLRRLEKTVLHWLSAGNIPALVSRLGEGRLAVLLQAGRNKRDLLTADLCLLWNKVRSFYPQWYIRGGTGNLVDGLGQVAAAFAEAEKALQASRMGLLAGDLPVAYRDLGLYRLFLEIPSEASLRSLCDDTIGRLLAYDRDGKGHLLPTLRSYLRYMNISQASAELFIHRHTLKYRLHKIHELTGHSPLQPEEALQLYVYLRLFDFLQASGSG